MSQITINNTAGYSQWFDLSFSSNKLRQSYVKGFFDISGGPLLLRSDNFLQFYKDSDVIPKLNINSTNLIVWFPSTSSTPNLVSNSAILDPNTTIYGTSSTYYDISNTKLVFIKDLSENVQLRLNDLRIKTQFQQIDINSLSTYFVTDVSINRRLFVGGDVSLNSRLTVYNDVSLNTRLFVGGDVSFNSRLTVYNDVSFNTRLFVGGDVSFNSRLTVYNDVSFNTRLFVGGDVSFNSRLTVYNDVSFNRRLFVGGDVSFNSRLTVYNDVSFNTRLFVGGDVSFNSRLTVYNDVSFNTRLFVGGDVSFNSNLVVTNTISSSKFNFITASSSNGFTFTPSSTNFGFYFGGIINSLGIVSTDDVSFNNRIFVNGDASFNNKLTVYNDVSLNNRLFVGGDVSFNKRLFIGYDTSINGNLTVTLNVTAQSFNATSDYRIKDFTKELNKNHIIDNIRPIEYINTILNKKDLGILAHELQEIYPFLVTGEKDGKELQTVNYNGIIALLVNEVKNLKKEFKIMKNELEILKNK